MKKQIPKILVCRSTIVKAVRSNYRDVDIYMQRRLGFTYRAIAKEHRMSAGRVQQIVARMERHFAHVRHIIIKYGVAP